MHSFEDASPLAPGESPAPASAQAFEKSEKGRDTPEAARHPESDSRAAWPPSTETTPAERSKKMILVVDDIQVNRQLLSRPIRRLGYPVVLASDGSRAITILEDNRDIGCVVTDLMMPGIDGRELIQSIRGNPGLAAIPVLVYSAVGSPEEIEEVVAWGATAVLEHPIDPVRLANHIDRYALRRMR